jgi:hypothetical protein
MSLKNIKPNYDRFKKVWKDLVDNQYKQSMLDFENANNNDVKFTDIELLKVSSCADGWTPHFWVSIEVGLWGYDDIETPMPTRYYIKTTPDRVSLQQDFLEEHFTSVWDTPSYVEKELIKALLADIVDEYENCFLEEFTAPAFRYLFERHYLSSSQFSEEAKMRYYEKYGEDSLLSQELKDMFIF